MKKLVLVLLLLTVPAMAQEKKDAPAPLPEKVEISAEQVKELVDASKNLRLATQDAEILSLQIEKAQKSLTELQEKAKKAQSEYSAIFFKLTKIPADKAAEYDVAEKDGKTVLTRKKQ